MGALSLKTLFIIIHLCFEKNIVLQRWGKKMRKSNDGQIYFYIGRVFPPKQVMQMPD